MSDRPDNFQRTDAVLPLFWCFYFYVQPIFAQCYISIPPGNGKFRGYKNGKLDHRDNIEGEATVKNSPVLAISFSTREFSRIILDNLLK